MDPTSHTLPGARVLTPLTQGKLSRLCGLYSILNGLQLALYPDRLSPADLQRLYLYAIDHLSRTRLLRRVLGVGMSDDTWLSLGEVLVGRLNMQRGTALAIEQILDTSTFMHRTQVLKAIAQRLRDGSPVLIGLAGALDHYTVISGYTRQSLIFFDSSKFRWVAKDRVGLEGDNLYLHGLWQRATLAIVDNW